MRHYTTGQVTLELNISRPTLYKLCKKKSIKLKKTAGGNYRYSEENLRDLLDVVGSDTRSLEVKFNIMNIFNHLRELLDTILEAMKGDKTLPAETSFKAVAIEAPHDKSHGDVAINAALVLARAAGMNPRELAEIIAGKLNTLDIVDHVDVAGPGFINLKLTPGFWQGRVPDILKSAGAYGGSNSGATY